MKITRILIFLCCLAFVPFVMGPKGCGGVIPMGVLDEAVDVDVVETVSGRAGELRLEGEPGEGGLGEGEPGAEEEGEDAPVVGKVAGPASQKAFCIEEAPGVEGEVKPGCPACNKLLPQGADVVFSFSLAEAFRNVGLMMFLGEMRTIVSNVMANLNGSMVLENAPEDLIRICGACDLSRSAGEGGAMREIELSGSMQEAPQMSIMGLPVGGGTVIPNPGKTVAPDWSTGGFCREFVLIIEGNWKEGASFEQYLTSLQGPEVLNALTFVAGTALTPPPVLYLQDRVELKLQPLEGGVIDVPGGAEEGLIDIPTKEPVILRQLAPIPTLRLEPESSLKLQPTGETTLYKAQALPAGESAGDLDLGGSGVAEMTSLSANVARLEDANIRVGFKEVAGVMYLVIGTEGYYSAVGANDSCPLEKIWRSLPEGLLKTAGPVEHFAWLFGVGANIVNVGDEVVMVYDFGEQLYMAFRTFRGLEPRMNVMFQIHHEAVDADRMFDIAEDYK